MTVNHGVLGSSPRGGAKKKAFGKNFEGFFVFPPITTQRETPKCSTFPMQVFALLITVELQFWNTGKAIIEGNYFYNLIRIQIQNKEKLESTF